MSLYATACGYRDHVAFMHWSAPQAWATVFTL